MLILYFPMSRSSFTSRGDSSASWALRLTTWFVSRLFGVVGLWKKGRATHTYGVGAKGSFKVTDSPRFPSHEFFSPGAEYPLQVRHATISYEDDAVKDVRSGSLKFSHSPLDSPLDLIMNTGEENAFWNLRTFLAFVWAGARGPKGLKSYCKRYPEGHRVARGSVRRAPDSFVQLRYYTKIPFHFHTREGVTMLVKFKLGPYEDLPDSGVVTGDDSINVWEQERLPTETRAHDYLRNEFLKRLDEGEVKYRLWMQCHTLATGESAEIYNAAKAWDERKWPWLEVGVATMAEPLCAEDCEMLRMRVHNMPASISVVPATSLSDYNSIGYARSRIYPYAQKLRIDSYQSRSKNRT